MQTGTPPGIQKVRYRKKAGSTRGPGPTSNAKKAKKERLKIPNGRHQRYSDYSGLYDDGYYKFLERQAQRPKMLVKTEPGFPDTPAVRIPLQNGMATLVDPGWFDFLIQFHWYAKKSFGCWYACRKVTAGNKVYFLRMHRIVAATLPSMVCHHINGNPLDNRSANLQNMSSYEHAKYYSYR